MKPVFLIIPMIICFGAGLALSVSSSEGEGLTLMDCYRLALKQSETTAISREAVRETEARFLQAVSGILPKVSFESSYMRQDVTGSSSSVLREVPESKFTFSQPLFSGFKEFASMAAGRAEERQRRHQQLRAEQLLFVDVSDAFYFFLSYHQDLEALEMTRAALEERVQELKKREALGRSRASETASAEARLRKTEADLESVKSQQDVFRQLMEFLTGAVVSTLIENLPVVAAERGLEDCLGKVDDRPDVRAGREAWEIAKKNIVLARVGSFPEVSLDGDYFTDRTGSAADVTWDATVKVSVPIFQGGENIGKIREAVSRAKQEELKFGQTRREALLEIRGNFTRWQSSLRQTQALQKAFEAAQKSYELQKEDYARHLVNNLEVLQSLQDLEDRRRDLIAADNESKQLYSHLLVSIGEIAP